jgi:hypothetical protein
MAKTYEPISSQTVGTAVATITFSSISQTYTDLVLVMTGTTSSTGASFFMRFNSDTTSLYSDTYLVGNGTSASSGRDSASTSIRVSQNATGGTLNVQRVNILQIFNYSNTSVFKTILARGNADLEVGLNAGLYRSTNAITAFDLFNGSSATFGVGTTFTLYGIKAAA